MVDGADINAGVERQGGAPTGLCGGTQQPPCATVRALPRWGGAYDACGACPPPATPPCCPPLPLPKLSRPALVAFLGLNSAIVEPDNRTIHGFYHSEAMCNYSAHFTNKSMSYALSTDGGLHWAKPNHPANVLLRSASRNFSSACAHCTAEGDATVVADGEYIYMHFMEWNGWVSTAACRRLYSLAASLTSSAPCVLQHGAGGFSAGLARAPAASRGRPGSWLKWHDGSFSQPAVGGQATAIAGITGAHVYLLEEEGRLVCLGYRQIP